MSTNPQLSPVPADDLTSVTADEFAQAMQQAFPRETEIVMLRIQNVKMRQTLDSRTSEKDKP